MASPFIWYELMTSDLEGAERFYKAVVEWDTEPFPASESPYIVVKAKDRGVGGMMTMPADVAAMGTPPMWLGYIYADDVDARTAAVKAAGGTVYQEPMDIPNVGRFSVVADPQGASFMLMKPIGPDDGASVAAMTPGHIGWHELAASDWKSAFDFYAAQFGWTLEQVVDMGPMGTYQLIKTGGTVGAGIFDKPKEMPVPVWLFYFSVKDIDAAARRVTQNGGEIILGPMEVPGGTWIITGKDPQGATFALVGDKS